MATVLDLYELSPTQQGMLFHTLYAPESGMYIEQRHCLLQGQLHRDAFQQAWQQVVNRYDVLRTDFHWRETDQPLQVVYDTVALPWTEADWQAYNPSQQAAKLETFLAQDLAQGFQLDQAPLMRCALFRLASDQYRFVWSYHHLLMDGWCNGVLIKDMLAIYQAHSQGLPLQLLPTRPYRDYIVWLQQQDRTQAADYWRLVLTGFEAPTPLGIERTGTGRGEGTEPLQGEQQARLSAALSTDLQAFAQGSRLTLNTLFQGAWAMILSRYSGQSDVLFGITIAGRPPMLTGVEAMVGLFINTVPLRSQVSGDALLLPWLQLLQAEQRQRETYGYSALTDLQAWSQVPRGMPLFESLLVFENYPLSIAAVTQNLDIDLSLQDGQGHEQTHYPLTLVVIPAAEIHISVRYDPSRISAAAVQRLLGHFETLLRQFVESPQRPLEQFGLLTAAEQQYLQRLAPGEVVDLAPDCVHQRFEAQVEQAPDAIAVTFTPHAALTPEVSTLSYQQLNQRANQLAQALQRQGIAPGMRVGLCLHRSLHMIVGLLAILKAGGTYIPLDPDYPAERLQYIVNDSQMEALLTTTDLETALALNAAVLTLCLDQLDPIDPPIDGVSGPSPPHPAPLIQPDDLAYIIYTSGSTGQPKGVPIRHRSLMNILTAMAAAPGLTADDTLLAVTTLAFDIAALEIFLPLITGAQVVITPRDLVQEGPQLATLLEHHNISVMQATPATWRLLQDCRWPGGDVKILCGGEALDLALGQWLLAQGQAVWNLYGPTETTIWSGAIQLTPQFLSHGHVPIGAPIANTQFYVLDSHQQQVPIGVPGELYIGGLGLAPGYWHRPQLTGERFIPTRLVPGTLPTASSAHLYKTGDRVRYQEDGTLEYLGRLDHQIKLRGFRIELGDIEAVLTQYPAVAQAIVVLRELEPPQLVAYLTLAASPSTDADASAARVVDELRQWIRSQLPNYMLPTTYLCLEAMPLTPNGKVDRRSLPAPDAVIRAAALPQTTVEVLIAGIWATVLGCDQIHVDDQFFELGGHSLLATRVIAQVRQILGVDVPLRSLFEHPVLADFVAVIEQRRGQPLPPIVPCEQPTLSYAQQRQWLMAQLEPDSLAYTIATAVRLQGNLSVSTLQQSFGQVVRRHEPLRTLYPAVDGNAVPQVLPIAEGVAAVAIEQIDLRHLAPVPQRSAVKQRMQAQAQQRFDLGQGPLWRVQLLQLSEQEYILLLALHHIIVDGWSLGVLLQELTACYQALLAQQPLPLPPLTIRYSDYAHWQKSLNCEAQLTYWQQQLSGAVPLLELPTDFPRPAAASWAGQTYEFRLTLAQTQALQRFSQQNGVTLFMTLLTAFNVLLYRYSGVTDLLIGTPIANRQRTELEGLIGLFVNTLVIRTDLSGNPRLGELLDRVRRVTLDAYSHQDLPFEQLIEVLDCPRSQGHTPLFQVMFALQNAPLDGIALDGLAWSPLPVDTGTAKFDLTLEMRETSRGLVGTLEYRSDLFRPGRIHRMAGHLRTLLKALPDSSQLPLSELPLLLRQEQQQLLAWRSPSPVPSGSAPLEPQLGPPGCIHRRFEQQAAETPAAIALLHRHTLMTYQALNQRANQLAHYLQAQGIGPETPVGLWATRSPQIIVAILAILKAGGAYVPLDPHEPLERLVWMITDTRMSVLLVEGPGETIPPRVRDAVEVVALGAIANQQPPYPTTNLPVQVVPTNLAYILYTSGSTGQPKGVCTLHQGVNRLVEPPNPITLDSSDVLLQAAPLTFDASTFEIWGALLQGGQLVLLPTDSPSLAELGDIIVSRQVTTLWLTSGLFNLMVDEALASLTSLRQLVTGGDVLSTDHLHKALAHLKNTRIINGYGPTEGTTFTCCHAITAEDLVTSPPIGTPIHQTQVYVLDADRQQVPMGLPGELYIGGAGLARGYLNQPELTAERFIPNPFYDVRQASGESLYLYRTGDRVRYRADGALEYLGRLDHQVKIRGFRIELGDIETVLVSHPDIQQAVVTVDGDTADQKRLVAYLQAPPLSSVPLRPYLLTRLPDYAIPAKFIQLDKFPLTANGKIDRRALPAPQWESDCPVTPQTAQEQQLADIWAAVLHLESVGLHDNFFDLGGDSILAMQIVSRAAQAGLTIAPKQLFQYQTVAELATVAQLDASTVIPQDAATGCVPLTPIQQWFFEQALAVPHYFNQSICLALPWDLDREALNQAVAAVYHHHDALRLRFMQTAQTWQQQYVETPPPAIQWFDLASLTPTAQDETIAHQAQTLQASLNLEVGPLVALGGFDLGHTRPSQLLIVIHHLVIDGVSWRILLADLQQAYQRLVSGESMALPPKTHSYQAWSNQLLELAANAEMAIARDDWQAIIRRGSLDLPQDNGGRDPHLENTFETSQRTTTTLSISQTQALLQTVPWVDGHRITAALLTALTRTLIPWTGQSHLLIDLETYGRFADTLDLSRTVGWFTCLYPVCLSLDPTQGLAAQLQSIRVQLQAVPHQGLSYGVLRYLKHQSDLAVTPAICFNYLGQLDRGQPETRGFRRIATPAANQAASNLRLHQIDINCWIAAGQLHLEWIYAPNRHNPQTMASLVQQFVEQLGALIDHCCSQPEPDYIPEDFSLAQLDQKSLETVLAQVGFAGEEQEVTP